MGQWDDCERGDDIIGMMIVSKLVVGEPIGNLVVFQGSEEVEAFVYLCLRASWVQAWAGIYFLQHDISMVFGIIDMYVYIVNALMDTMVGHKTQMT